MDRIIDFFNMGGYAFYIWTSYGLAFIVLIANLIIPINQKRTTLKMLARKARRKKYDQDDTHA